MNRFRFFLLILSAVGFARADAAADRALVKVPVANLRTAPSHASELASQAVMGTPVRVIEQVEDSEWLEVATPDGYTGYMISNSLQPVSDEELSAWQKSRRITVAALNARLRGGNRGMNVAPLGPGCVLQIAQHSGEGKESDIELITPDGRRGLLSADEVKPFLPFLNDSTYAAHGSKPDVEQIIVLGKELLGQEYLWGGTSAKANDCSGFTRVLFQSERIYLPRDAWQQALCGVEVSAREAVPGDLVFFKGKSGRVNHVGLYLGDGLMLHSSGMVRINRLKAPRSSAFTTDGVSGLSPEEFDLYYAVPAMIRRVTTLPSASGYDANRAYFGTH